MTKFHVSCFSRCLSVNDILDILEVDEDDTDSVDVVIQPPEGDLSDGYSGSEDEGEKDPDHLSATVLQAPAELWHPLPDPTDEDCIASDFDDDETPTTSGGARSRGRIIKRCRRSQSTRRVQERFIPTWKRAQSLPPRNQRPFPEFSYDRYIGKTPQELFFLFWDYDFLNFICIESNEYSLRNGRPNLKVNSASYS